MEGGWAKRLSLLTSYIVKERQKSNMVTDSVDIVHVRNDDTVRPILLVIRQGGGVSSIWRHENGNGSGN
jgi:hypothetical protein